MAVARTPSSSTAADLPATQAGGGSTAPLRLHRGGTIEHPVIAYECWGRLNARATTRSCCSPACRPRPTRRPRPRTRGQAGGRPMIGEGKPIDTRRFFVVCINSIGSPFGSSSPASSVNPATGRAFGIAFPEISVEDIAAAGHEVMRAPRHRARRGRGRSVARRHDGAGLHARSSRTGSATWCRFPARRAPRRSRSRCARCSGRWCAAIPPGAAATTSRAAGRAWGCGSRASSAPSPIARPRNGTSDSAAGACRTPRALPRDFRPQFEVEAYLEHQAHRFAEIHDANCLPVRLARDGPVRPRRARRRFARRRVREIPCRAFADHRRGVGHAVHDRPAAGDRRSPEGGRAVRRVPRVPSPQGHDAFLVDLDRFEPAIGEFLSAI